MLVGMAGAACAGETDLLAPVSSKRGEAMFEGREPLTGMIRGHTSAMPPEVLACGGCHQERSSDPGKVAQAPTLDAKSLLEPKARRYGPASAYTLDTFCRVLRTGVDPVSVTVGRTMPVFVVDPQQCESLWRYIMDRT